MILSINKEVIFVYKEKVLVIHIQELVKKHNISLRELSKGSILNTSTTK